MSSNDPKETRPEILDAVGDELQRSISAQEQTNWILRARRGLGVPLAIALALPVGAGIAVASGVVSDSEPTVSSPVYEPVEDDGGPPLKGVNPGDVVGYIDLSTGDPIMCADGERLVREYGERRPTCADGTVPEVYTEQEAAWTEWLESQENLATPEPPENGPNFQVPLNEGS